MASLKLTELFSFAWAFTNSRLIDYYRHYFSEVVTVNTKSGPVKGFKIASTFDFQYMNFVGIPYAKNPTGEQRFKVGVVRNVFVLKVNEVKHSVIKLICFFVCLGSTAARAFK